MEDCTKKPPVSWGVVLSLLTLLGGGVAAYSDVKSDQARLEVRIEHTEGDVMDLDDYDIHLTEVTDTLKGESIRTETEMSNLQRTTEKLEVTMSEMLKEVRRMNDNLIRIGVQNEERN